MTTSVTSDNYLAALDIGSNSFHFVLARHLGEHIQILHTEKYRAQLAQGLSEDFILSEQAIERGVAILANLAETSKQLTKDNFRIVATYTLRKAKNVEAFLNAAAKVFPFDIEIVSGHEEARLIYQGVNANTQSSSTRMVIDIGGGSTECIIGKKSKVAALASLTMGCVSYTKLFFNQGQIKEKAFDKAIRSAKHEIDSIVKHFKKHDFSDVIGTSGTLKSIYRIINHGEHLAKPFTLKDINTLKNELISCKHVDDIKIDGLKEARREVICAGVAITIALMERFNIREIDFCQYALREGVLYEQIDNLTHNNVRKRTVNSFCERFNIDMPHADNVKEKANHLFAQVKKDWGLTTSIYKELLNSAILLHELGLDINPAAYHKHGQYIIENADLPGFNQEQQQALSWLVGNQRKKITPLIKSQWHILKPNLLEKLCIIIRFSIILTQQRYLIEPHVVRAHIKKNTIALDIDQQWLIERPIVDSELLYEKEHMLGLGLSLELNIMV